MENLSLHPQRKELLLLLYKEIESIEHTPQRVKQRKRRTRNLSRFQGTKPNIFKPTISDSNMVGMASNFGDLIPHLGHVDALSLFEDWLSETSDLRDVLSIRYAIITEQSSFGSRIVWIVKQCPFELNFGEQLGDSWIYIPTKIHAQWSTSL